MRVQERGVAVGVGGVPVCAKAAHRLHSQASGACYVVGVGRLCWVPGQASLLLVQGNSVSGPKGSPLLTGTNLASKCPQVPPRNFRGTRTPSQTFSSLKLSDITMSWNIENHS